MWHGEKNAHVRHMDEVEWTQQPKSSILMYFCIMSAAIEQKIEIFFFKLLSMNVTDLTEWIDNDDVNNTSLRSAWDFLLS